MHHKKNDILKTIPKAKNTMHILACVCTCCIDDGPIYMNLLIQMTATAVKPIELLQKYRVYRMDMAQMIVKPMFNTVVCFSQTPLLLH